MNMFEKATKMQLRWMSPQGTLDVEDLWNLPLKTTKITKASLDGLAIELDRELKNNVSSFVDGNRTSPQTMLNQLRFDLVKYVIDAKVSENNIAKLTKEKAEKKERLLGFVAQKQDQELANMSVEKLQGMIADL